MFYILLCGKYLTEEIKHGAMVGPFTTPPIPDLHISPLMSRPKANTKKRRIIVDLSYPAPFAVNSHIQNNMYLNTPFILTLPTVDDIKNTILAKGKGCHLAKVDLSCAFRHIKIDPRDYFLLGIQHQGYYHDLACPFGFCLGSAFFQRISDAVRHMMRQMDYDITNYIDDTIICDTTSKCSPAFHTLVNLLGQLGFQLNKDKIVAPSTKMSCLGIVFDTEKLTMSVPQEKMQEIHHKCKSWQDRTSCTVNELQSLLGSLLYISKCVSMSRVFLNRMLEVLRKNHGKRKIQLDQEFHKDIQWFVKFMPQFNGTTFFDPRPISATLELDACLTGLGGRFGAEIYALPLPVAYQHLDIAYLEMINILVAIRLWGHNWANKKVLIKCDNQAVVSILKSGRTRDSTLATITRNILLEASWIHITITVIHVLGKNNTVADTLSRWQNSAKDRQILHSNIINPIWVQANASLLILDLSI